MIDISYHTDSIGRLGQANMDFGDSLQRTSSYIVLQTCLGNDNKEEFKAIIKSYKVADGRYVRYPTSKTPEGRYIPWYGEPNNLSADQSVVLQAAMVVTEDKDSMLELVKARTKRALFHFNTVTYDDQEPITKKLPDPPRPIEVSQFIRGLNAWYLYPVLLATDLQLLTDLYFRSSTERHLYDGDNTMLPILLSSLYKYPTPWGVLARYFYSKTDAVKRLEAYHAEGPGLNGNAALGKLYVNTFIKLINKGEMK